MSQKRPLSPFMIGPYYRPQITSMMSIIHRATGVFLATGSLALLWVLVTLSMSQAAFAATQDCLNSTFGRLLTFTFTVCLMYHLFNGIRHLFWDIGKGFDIPSVNRSGYAVIALTLLSTSVIWWLAMSGGGTP